jgi:hypothetical protein
MKRVAVLVQEANLVSVRSALVSGFRAGLTLEWVHHKA